MEIDHEKLDEIVLALLYYNSWKDRYEIRTWKSLDWDAMDRLHEKDLIGNPKGTAKSVALTEESFALGKELFEKHFGIKKDS